MNEVSVELLIGGIICTAMGLVCILKPKAIIRGLLKVAAVRYNFWTGSLPTEKDKKRLRKEIEWGVVNGKTNHMFGCGRLFLLFWGLGAFGLGVTMLVIYFKGV